MCKAGQKSKNRFWLFHLCNIEKKAKYAYMGRNKCENSVRLSAQCFILFGFGQEFSFRFIPKQKLLYIVHNLLQWNT